ncbi:MAG: response regulator transcription factor [Candidatus Sericytochromatia bacterium]
MKLLIIEDENYISEVLKKGLEEEGFFIDLASDGEEGLYYIKEFSYDAIILDLSLGKIDGLDILKISREKGNQTPILILTARNEIRDKIKGLNLGADDYLTKPFDFDELLARVQALIRRSKQKASPIIKLNNLELNLETKNVTRDGINILLSSKEYNLLEYLMINSGKVISRNEIMEHVYSSEFESDSNIIDVYINYLRNKIDKNHAIKLIKTVRGHGYILSE